MCIGKYVPEIVERHILWVESRIWIRLYVANRQREAQIF